VPELFSVIVVPTGRLGLSSDVDQESVFVDHLFYILHPFDQLRACQAVKGQFAYSAPFLFDAIS
jgi:hypothetical protein